MDIFRPEAEADRDSELDAVLREIGNEFLEPEIPERLLRALRAAAGAADKAQPEAEGERSPNRSGARTARTRGR
jgi:hypothetical protein